MWDSSGSSEANRFDEPVPPGVVAVCGAEGSPYTQKVLTALRYRRIPHRFIIEGGPESDSKPNPLGPKLLPKILMASEGAELIAMGDSTPILQNLERRYPGRSLYPEAAGLKLLALLLEDFCDEWVTKAMYHYRWTHDADAAAYGIGVGQAGSNVQMREQIRNMVGQRQVSRKHVVGSNATTGPIIEESFMRLLRLLEAHFDAGFEYLFGSRPSAADFALFGQMSPMVSLDPNVSQKIFAQSRRTWFWVHAMRDLSGRSLLEEAKGWIDEKSPLPPTLHAIFAEVGRLYAPFMLANAKAVSVGAADVEALLDGGQVLWKQPSFKYQAKCLRILHEEYGSLAPSDRAWVGNSLEGTGCSCLFDSVGAGTPNSRL